MKKLVKISLFVVLFTSIGLFNIGGCGGGNGGGNGGGVILSGPCPMPTLNSDFENFNYSFVDLINEGLIVVMSNGVEVIIEYTEAGRDDIAVFFADVLGPEDCSITGISLNNSPVSPASGNCQRLNEGQQFSINGLIVNGVEQPNAQGSCIGPQ